MTNTKRTEIAEIIIESMVNSIFEKEDWYDVKTTVDETHLVVTLENSTRISVITATTLGSRTSIEAKVGIVKGESIIWADKQEKTIDGTIDTINDVGDILCEMYELNNAVSREVTDDIYDYEVISVAGLAWRSENLERPKTVDIIGFGDFIYGDSFKSLKQLVNSGAEIRVKKADIEQRNDGSRYSVSFYFHFNYQGLTAERLSALSLLENGIDGDASLSITKDGDIRYWYD